MKLTDQMIKEAGDEAMEMRVAAILENEKIPEHEFSEEFEANMEELIRSQKDKKEKAYTVWAWRMVRAAAVLAFMLVSISASTVSLEASRSKLIDVVITKPSKTDTRFEFSSSEKSTGELGEITFTYLPEGMVEVDREEDEDILYRFVDFEDEDGRFMCFQQVEVVSTSSYVMEMDTFKMEESLVPVNGIEATLYIGEEWSIVDGEYTTTGMNRTVLLWQEGSFTFELSGYISAEEIIQVAEGIKIN